MAQAAPRSSFGIGSAASITVVNAGAGLPALRCGGRQRIGLLPRRIYCGWACARAPRHGRYRISAATSPQAAAAAIQ